MAEITPEEQTARLWSYLKGFHAVHLVNVGVELGIFERFRRSEGALSAADLAGALGLHGHYVEVWCKTACAYELLDAVGAGEFRLAPHIDLLLAGRGNPRYLAPYFTASIEHIGRDMERYPEYFKSGETYTYQEHGQAFSEAIAEITAGFHVVVARRLLPAIPGQKDKLEAGSRILDMGCGAGGLVMQIAKAYPKSTCLGVDVDGHGVAMAERRVAEAGLGDRVRIEHLDGEFIGHEDEFDLVTLFEVLHEIPVEARPQVLANCHAALKPGGVLFVLDETYPSTLDDLRKPEYGFAVQTAFNELIWGNVVPTREDQDSLLAGAGFADVERTLVADAFTAITAIKP